MGHHVIPGIIDSVRNYLGTDRRFRKASADITIIPIPGRSFLSFQSSSQDCPPPLSSVPGSASGSTSPPPRLSNPFSQRAGLLSRPSGCERAQSPCPGSSREAGPPQRLPLSASQAPNLLLLRTVPPPAPSASGTSCLMERELAPGKTMNFNASEHSNQIEAYLPGKVRRGFKIMQPNLHLGPGRLGSWSKVPQLVSSS